MALLDPASGWPLEPAGWLEPLASLAARSPVNDAGEAARLLRALGADADGDGPWTLLDAASLPGAG